MKTKVRIVKSNPTVNSLDGKMYQNLIIQVLKSDGVTIGVACELEWLATEENPEWFNMEFFIKTDRYDDIAFLHKIAKRIEKANLYWNEKTPEAILNVLDAERYVYDHSYFVPESMDGCKLYAIKKGDDVWKHFHAVSENQVYQETQKLAANSDSGVNWNYELIIEKVKFKIENLKSDLS
jgi:hypothetical protein